MHGTTSEISYSTAHLLRGAIFAAARSSAVNLYGAPSSGCPRLQPEKGPRRASQAGVANGARVCALFCCSRAWIRRSAIVV
jgi:hypothetical protein